MRCPLPLILASQSPRRRELLTQAGYEFTVQPPHESAECGICTRETPPTMVARLAFQKARDVAVTIEREAIVLGCDTVAECQGQILGKPHDRDHAHQMLTLLRGQPHRVYSGLCLWHRPSDRTWGIVDVTELKMDPISDAQLEDYLDTDQWQGKAGAFGFQDGLDWIQITAGSAANVVGLPLERLATLLQEIERELAAS